MDLHEKAVQFGKGRGLSGVLHLVAHGSPDTPAIIFLNSGILHSVGASRLHVRLARLLAQDQVPSLRFDQSTIGDSGARQNDDPYLESAISETQEAISLVLQSTGASRCILFGLCSGSDVAFEVAKIDNRVCGLIQLDPYVYRTYSFYYHHYRARIFFKASWKNTGRRLACALQNVRLPGSKDTESLEDTWFESPEYVREFPAKAYVRSGYKELSAKGVQFLCIFSGGMAYVYNHCGQLQRSIGKKYFANKLQEFFFPASTHIFTDYQDQIELCEVVHAWLKRTFLHKSEN